MLKRSIYLSLCFALILSVPAHAMMKSYKVESFLKDPIAVNQGDANGDTALHHAVEAGDVKSVVRLICCGALLDVQNRAGNTPLHEALLGLSSFKGDSEKAQCYTNIVRILCKEGAKPDIKNGRNDASIDLPVKLSLPDPEVLSRILADKSEDVRSLDEYLAEYDSHRKVLFAAVFSGRDDIVRWVIGKHPEAVNWCSNDGTLLSAAVMGGRAQVVKTLIELGARVDLADEIGITPLLQAIVDGRLKAVRVLLEHGANPEAVGVARDLRFATRPRPCAKDLATREGFWEMVRLLEKSPVKSDLAMESSAKGKERVEYLFEPVLGRIDVFTDEKSVSCAVRAADAAVPLSELSPEEVKKIVSKRSEMTKAVLRDRGCGICMQQSTFGEETDIVWPNPAGFVVHPRCYCRIKMALDPFTLRLKELVPLSFNDGIMPLNKAHALAVQAVENEMLRRDSSIMSIEQFFKKYGGWKLAQLFDEVGIAAVQEWIKQGKPEKLVADFRICRD